MATSLHAVAESKHRAPPVPVEFHAVAAGEASWRCGELGAAIGPRVISAGWQRKLTWRLGTMDAQDETAGWLVGARAQSIANRAMLDGPST
jgi:hypothetical protein